MRNSILHLAAIQLCSSTDVQSNLIASTALISAAAAKGATLICTPEMTSVLNKKRGAIINNAFSEDCDPALSHYRTLAQTLAVTLIIGSLPIKVNAKQCANRCYVIHPNGAIACRYDKLHMFDVNLGKGGLYQESAEYRPGEAAVLAKLPSALIGLSICYDLRFPALYQALATAGANIICVPAAFTQTTGEAHWGVLLRARAIETGAFIIAPAQAGLHEDGRRTYGNSMIINPWGEIIAQTGQETGFIDAEIDLKEVETARHKIPNLQHLKAFTLP